MRGLQREGKARCRTDPDYEHNPAKGGGYTTRREFLVEDTNLNVVLNARMTEEPPNFYEVRTDCAGKVIAVGNLDVVPGK